ncbi:hypothetical protein B0H15DRAFT_518141 [Mycena belliarum]|uniref:Uncharacterized protein n=1 Tax=Mycena belliarum TaxID=1033014 RepID=A0AAD6TX06_9AGAR|nr:hypothetical protein B0H15DRAFT_518141 [Mycena belliae]
MSPPDEQDPQTFVMFVLTLYKCCTTMRAEIHHVMPIWQLFLRDGVVWFVVVFVATGTELFIWATGRESLKQLLVSPALVVYSIVVSRTLLNIKEIMVPKMEIPEQNPSGPNVV